MANLLYKGYKKGCYNGINTETQTITGYYYNADDLSMASYYADLQPNTTYTLSKIDTSNRFRIATYTEDVKLKNEGNQTALSQWWFADEQTQITFTTGANDIYLVVYYTNNSEYNTRIMLNEGTVAQPYEAPTNVIPHVGIWTVLDGRLMHSDLPEPLTGNYIQAPYPPFWWYAHDGKLTHDGLPEPISAIMSEPYPPFWWYVENGRLKTSVLPAPAHTGAFYGCSRLATAHIPKSVKRIGEYAFAGTALTKVKIASDCTYYPTSFPDGCKIEFYPDDNESVGDNDGQ